MGWWPSPTTNQWEFFSTQAQLGHQKIKFKLTKKTSQHKLLMNAMLTQEPADDWAGVGFLYQPKLHALWFTGNSPQNYHPTHFSYNFHPSSQGKKRVTSIFFKPQFSSFKKKSKNPGEKKFGQEKKKTSHFPTHIEPPMPWYGWSLVCIASTSGWSSSPQGAVGGWFRRWIFGRMGIYSRTGRVQW